jgi:hypothetical protein
MTPSCHASCVSPTALFKHQDGGSSDTRTVRLGNAPWKNWAFYGRDDSRTR